MGLRGEREGGRLTRHAGIGAMSDCARTGVVEKRKERARARERDLIVILGVVLMDERASNIRKDGVCERERSRERMRDERVRVRGSE